MPAKSEGRSVRFKGQPLNLVGSAPVVGRPAPDFTVNRGDLSAARLADFKGRTCVLVSVPSLDTPVCDLEAKRFNQEAAGLGEDVAVAVISMDLPFAQSRWCGAAGAKNIVALSDFNEASFGRAYGVLIKELRLLARAVFVVDRAGTLQYSQLVPELTNEPDYASVLDAIKKLR